jgi:superfamily I DNA/RNA helicase
LSLAIRCERLLKQDSLLPQDVLVLTFRRDRAHELAAAISARIGEGRVHLPFEDSEKNRLAIQPGHITVSTASARGYDAPLVMLASADDFPEDIQGRVSFYVGCTRAREWLDISWVDTTNLVREFERAARSVQSR